MFEAFQQRRWPLLILWVLIIAAIVAAPSVLPVFRLNLLPFPFIGDRCPWHRFDLGFYRSAQSWPGHFLRARWICRRDVLTAE